MISLSIRDQTMSVLAKFGGMQLIVHRVVPVSLLPAKPSGRPDWVMA